MLVRVFNIHSEFNWYIIMQIRFVIEPCTRTDEWLHSSLFHITAVVYMIEIVFTILQINWLYPYITY